MPTSGVGAAHLSRTIVVQRQEGIQVSRILNHASTEVARLCRRRSYSISVSPAWKKRSPTPWAFASCRDVSWTRKSAADVSSGEARDPSACRPFRRKEELGLVCSASSSGQSGGEFIPKQLRQELSREFPELDEKDIEEIFLNLQLESSLDSPQARAHYEIMFLIHEDNFDEVPRVTKKCQDFVAEKGGVVWRLNDWGLRRLAYKIQKARKANYILMNIELAPAAMLDFDRMLGSDERIIRRLVTREERAITESCPPPPEYDSFQLARQDTEIAAAEAVFFDSEDEDDDEDEDWEEVGDEEEEEEDEEEEWVPITVEELKNQGQKSGTNNKH